MKKILIIIVIMLSTIWITGCGLAELKCDGPVGDSTELYYYKQYLSNVSSDNSYNCNIRNSTLDVINREQRKLAYEQLKILTEERRLCYLDGDDHNVTFDLIKDYGFSCDKIQYINDHLLLSSEKKNGGTISGSSSGFFSSGHIKGQLYDWVNTENLATGQLIKTAAYHLDCNNETLYWKSRTICDSGKIFPDEVSSCWNPRETRETKELTYYNEGDFVMYYVNNCVE